VLAAKTTTGTACHALCRDPPAYAQIPPLFLLPAEYSENESPFIPAPSSPFAAARTPAWQNDAEYVLFATQYEVRAW